jgi:hypothetical protein
MRLRWSNLRPVGNSWPARLTVLIPLVGYFIIFNAKLAGYGELIREVAGAEPTDLSVSPRLFQIYFGLCFVAVGATIYALACPQIVKRYGTGGAFAGGDGRFYGLFGIHVIRDTLVSEGYEEAVVEIERRYSHPLPQDGRPPSDEETYQLRNAFLHLYFSYLNRSGPAWCWISAILYACGFAILIVPSIKVFWRVLVILSALMMSHGLWSFL